MRENGLRAVGKFHSERVGDMMSGSAVRGADQVYKRMCSVAANITLFLDFESCSLKIDQRIEEEQSILIQAYYSEVLQQQQCSDSFFG